MKVKAVFFDIDGTILPFDGIIYHSQKTCKHFKVRVLTKKEIIKYTIGYKITESIPRLLPETKKFIKQFANYYRTSYINDVKSWKPFPYVKNVFRWIKNKKIKIGIITTKTREQAKANLESHQIPYDVIIGSDNVKKRKPSPEPLFKACKILKIEPKDSLFCGDHPFDMQAAKSTGCTAVGVLTGWGKKRNLKKAGADFIIKDLRGLRNLIK